MNFRDKSKIKHKAEGGHFQKVGGHVPLVLLFLKPTLHP